MCVRVTKPLRPDDPRKLGGYRLLARLGEGGMGAVYLAEDLDGRRVAIKLIRAELATEPEFRARFRSEVSRARQVPPFCTAAVLEADPEHPTPYLVVEYVEGADLGELVRRNGPLRGGNLHSVAVGVATALAAIHSAGVIHRDLKPSNVLFSLGAPKVIDFGIARAVESGTDLTRPDQMVGTIAYMAPERFATGDERQQAGPPADIFAWGVLIAYAATGRTPFAGDSPVATAGRILTQPPDLSGLTDPIRDLVAAALDKDPGSRPTAYELLDLLLNMRDAAAAAGLAERPQLRWAAFAARNSGMPGTADEAWAEVARRRRSRRALRAGAVVGLAALLLGAALVAAPGARHLLAAPAGDPQSTAPAAVALGRLDAWQPADPACRLTADGLEVLPDSEPAQLCPGPLTVGNVVVAVRVALAGNHCGAVWLRRGPEAGFLVSFCHDRVIAAVDRVDHRPPLVLAEERLWGDLPAGHLMIVATGPYLDVTVNGTPVVRTSYTDRRLPEGGLALGSVPDPRLPGPPTDRGVTFTDLQVWQPG